MSKDDEQKCPIFRFVLNTQGRRPRIPNWEARSGRTIVGPLRLGYREGSAKATISGTQTSQISGEQAVSRPSECPSKVKRRVSISGYVFFSLTVP